MNITRLTTVFIRLPSFKNCCTCLILFFFPYNTPNRLIHLLFSPITLNQIKRGWGFDPFKGGPIN